MNLRISFSAPACHWLSALCVTLLLTAGVRLPAQAQAGAPATIRLQPEDLERGQYGPQHNFYFLPPGVTGENYVSAGFFGQKLRPYLGTNQQALAELNNYKRQKTLYLVDRALFVGSVVLYASQVYRDNELRYTTPPQLAAGGLLVTSLVATLFINRHTNEYLKQAVDNYNSDLPAARRGSLRQLRPNTLGLAATPQGRPVLAVSWQL